MTIPRPRERVAVCYESTMRGYLELRVRSYDSKDPDVAKLFASEHVYVREDVAEAEAAALRRERDALAAEVAKLRHGIIIAREDTTDAVTRATLDLALTSATTDRDAVLAGKGVG